MKNNLSLPIESHLKPIDKHSTPLQFIGVYETRKNCVLSVSGFILQLVSESGVLSSKMADLSSPKAEEVRAIIKRNKIVIFSKTTCPYCTLAKECFDKLGTDYLTVELNQRGDGDEVQSILGAITGARTVPRVFVNEKCLGGGSDVKALYDRGELATIVA